MSSIASTNIHNVAPYTESSDTRIFPKYDQLAWLNSLPLYNLQQWSDEMLDLLREIQASGKYYFQAKPFPIWNPGDTGIVAGGNTSGIVSIPPYSYLVAASAFSSLDGTAFKIRVYDKGAKVDLFDKVWAWDKVFASNTETQNAVEVGNVPPHLFMAPMIVLPPGLLQVQIANMDLTRANVAQILFHFAVPKNPASMGQLVVGDSGVAV